MEIYTILDNTLNQGLIYGFLALSVYISLRVLDFPDLSIEGSFPFGAAITAFCAKTLGNSYAALPLSLLLGFCVGMFTAFLHTNLKIGKLLSGILVSIGLYSLNFRIMGAKANVYLLGKENLLRPLNDLDKRFASLVFDKNTPVLIYPLSNLIYIIFIAVILFLFYKFLNTQKGTLIRFSRSNSKFFLESLGIDQKKYLVLGLGFANAFSALAGSLVAFQSGSSSLSMGFGIILVGLVSLVIGEQIIKIFHSDLTNLWPSILSPFIGTFFYYLIIRLIRWLNTVWQTVFGFPDPTNQFQFFNSDVRIISVLIMIFIYIFRRKELIDINLPERL